MAVSSVQLCSCIYEQLRRSMSLRVVARWANVTLPLFRSVCAMCDAYSVMGFLYNLWLVLLHNSISVIAKNCQWLFFYYASAVQVIGCNRCVNQWFGENDDDGAHARHVAPKLRKRPSASFHTFALSEQAAQVLFQDDDIPEDNSNCRFTCMSFCSSL